MLHAILNAIFTPTVSPVSPEMTVRDLLHAYPETYSLIKASGLAGALSGEENKTLAALCHDHKMRPSDIVPALNTLIRSRRAS